MRKALTLALVSTGLIVVGGCKPTPPPVPPPAQPAAAAKDLPGSNAVIHLVFDTNGPHNTTEVETHIRADNGDTIEWRSGQPFWVLFPQDSCQGLTSSPFPGVYGATQKGKVWVLTCALTGLTQSQNPYQVSSVLPTEPFNRKKSHGHDVLVVSCKGCFIDISDAELSARASNAGGEKPNLSAKPAEAPQSPQAAQDPLLGSSAVIHLRYSTKNNEYVAHTRTDNTESIIWRSGQQFWLQFGQDSCVQPADTSGSGLYPSKFDKTNGKWEFRCTVKGLNGHIEYGVANSDPTKPLEKKKKNPHFKKDDSVVSCKGCFIDTDDLE